MIFKNSFKVLFSNFSLVWKSGLYKLIISSIVVFLSIGFLRPVIADLNSANFFSGISNLAKDGIFSSGLNGVIVNLFGLIKTFVDVVFVPGHTLNIVMICLFYVIILPFFFNLSKVAETEVLYGAMSCNSNFGFMASYIRNLMIAIRLSMFKFLFSIPFVALCLGAIFLVSTFTALNIFLAMFLAFLVLLILVSVFSCFKVLQSCFEPATILQEFGPIRAFKHGYKAVMKKFGSIFSSNFVLVILTLFVNVFVGLYTFGLGLIITLPACMVLYTIMSMVSYYYSMGMNFYSDPEHIVRTIKLEDFVTVKQMRDIF